MDEATRRAKEEQRDQQIDKLNNINLSLRQKIKLLNQLVEKVLERQQQASPAQPNQQNQRVQMETLLNAREKELNNAQKQIEQNDSQIQKLQQKLGKLQKQANNGASVDWESKYREQLELQ